MRKLSGNEPQARRQLLRVVVILDLLILAGCGAPRVPPAAPILDPEIFDDRSLLTEEHLQALESIQADEIQTHVDVLASDALRGRWARGSEAKIAARYIADQFAQAGLQPAGDEGTWFQALDEDDLAPNVVGLLPGLGQGWVVIGAHYDHLRPRTWGVDRIFNGADDNASGTAALLELADAFGGMQADLHASIVLVAFSAEELGLLGSTFFVANPHAELEQLRAAVNVDMISRGEENLVFCEGSDRSPWLRDIAQKANQHVGLDVHYDEHPEWISSSDHFPFMMRGVPTLYFGVEDHADYHKVSDHSDRILPELTARVAELVFLITVNVAGPAQD